MNHISKIFHRVPLRVKPSGTTSTSPQKGSPIAVLPLNGSSSPTAQGGGSDSTSPTKPPKRLDTPKSDDGSEKKGRIKPRNGKHKRNKQRIIADSTDEEDIDYDNPIRTKTRRGKRPRKSKNAQSIIEATGDDDLLEAQEYFHGVLPRAEVQHLLRQEGDFLVRQTVNKEDKSLMVVLSVMVNRKTSHFIVQVDDSGWFRFEGESFDTVPKLIEYYQLKQESITSASKAILKKPIRKEAWELSNDCIVDMQQELGKGNSGLVKKGIYYAINEKGQKVGTEVALKQCNESMPQEEKTKFLAEARILRRYDHPNIVKLIGVCVQRDPLMIVMELVRGGSLLSFLQKRRKANKPLTEQQLVMFCLDAAKGMEYLESKQCIHRDLSARNCLLGDEDERTVKISDFGMSREGSSYELGGARQLPIRWTAPEALTTGMYTAKSDVWSYGVLMWEIFTYGQLPYSDMENKQISEMVAKGSRLTPPKAMPTELQKLMQSCWKVESEQRPSFSQIRNELTIYYETNFGKLSSQTTTITSTTSPMEYKSKSSA